MYFPRFLVAANVHRPPKHASVFAEKRRVIGVCSEVPPADMERSLNLILAGLLRFIPHLLAESINDKFFVGYNRLAGSLGHAALLSRYGAVAEFDVAAVEQRYSHSYGIKPRLII